MNEAIANGLACGLASAIGGVIGALVVVLVVEDELRKMQTMVIQGGHANVEVHSSPALERLDELTDKYRQGNADGLRE